MDTAALLSLVTDLLPEGATVLVPDDDVAETTSRLRPSATPIVGPMTREAAVDAIILLAGEVAAAGERGPAVIDAAVATCRPGGMVFVAVPSRVHADLTGTGSTVGSLTAGQLSHMLGERGLELRLLAAPGAAAALARRPWAGASDLAMDTTPGLLDAGPTILAVAQTPRSESERSRRFFDSITTRIVAAAVLCLDADDRVLVVFDIYKGAWTLPGGLVDAGESPLDGAVREAREEGGVDVAAGDLLGVFAHERPHRVHLIYAARPVEDVPHPAAVHDHEISEVRWVPLDGAYDLLRGDIARKVRLCLTDPGRTWHW